MTDADLLRLLCDLVTRAQLRRLGDLYLVTLRGGGQGVGRSPALALADAHRDAAESIASRDRTEPSRLQWPRAVLRTSTVEQAFRLGVLVERREDGSWEALTADDLATGATAVEAVSRLVTAVVARSAA